MGGLGAAAGAIAAVKLQPLLYCKNMVQQKLPITFEPRKWYRGLGMNCGSMTLLTGLQFLTSSKLKQFLTGGANRNLTNGETLLSALAGGMLSGIPRAPMELVMIQQQNFGLNILQTPQAIIRKYGFQGLTRGLTTSVAREGVFTMGYLGMTPVVSDYLHNQMGYDVNTAKAIATVSSGVLAGTVSHPMDTLKTCMQGDIGRDTYGTISESGRLLLKQAGIKRFFDGLAWRTVRMICVFGILNECKNQLWPYMYPHHRECVQV